MEPTPHTPLAGRRILLAVDAGPEAFEAPALARALIRAGATVQIAARPEVEAWVRTLTLEAVSRGPVAHSADELRRGGFQAELVIAHPVGPDLLALAAAGREVDAASAALLRSPRRLISLARGLPDHPWVRAHAEALAEVSAVLGPGAAIEALVEAAAAAFPPRDLEGARVLVTAGPTREHLDPVRFISNPSTGKMGYALAAACAARGASVLLVSGPTALPCPAGVRRLEVVSAAELAGAVQAHEEGVDLFIATAAVGDYRPAAAAPQKIKKGEGPMQLTLERTPDVLREFSERARALPRPPILVGFAAETEEVEAYGRQKLASKGVDLIVANEVSGAQGAFGRDDNAVWLVSEAGSRPLPRASKGALAHQILDEVAPLVAARAKEPA